MARIPDHLIDTVRQAADIVEVVGAKVRLNKAGRSFKGVCPFHGDKDPSLIVNPDRGTWHCFGCHEGGNVFNFLMRSEGLNFPEAVRYLAGRYGVILPEPELTPAQKQKQAHYDRLLQALQITGKFFQDNLHGPAGAAALRYLREHRGLSEATIEEYGLGFVPDGWDNLGRRLSSEGIEAKIGIEAGVLVEKDRGRGHYDRFRGRVMVPIRDSKGRNVSFGGRVLGDGEPKYLNGPESPVFHKSNTLFNLDVARKAAYGAGRILVMEGYFDVIVCAQYGIKEAVAPMGTALTEGQIKLIAGRDREIFLVFDGDQAGRRAAARALPMFQEAELAPKALLLPEGEDPDSFIRAEGLEGMEAALEAARPLTEVVLAQIIDASPLDSPEDKSRVVLEAGKVIKAIKDPVSSWLYLGWLAKQLELPERVVAARLGIPLPDEGGRRRPAGPRRGEAPPPQDSRAAEWQECTLQLAMTSAEAAQVLKEHGVLNLLAKGPLQPLVEEIEKLLEEGLEPDPAAIIQRLEDRALHSLVGRIASCGPPLEKSRATEAAQAQASAIKRRFMHGRRGRHLARSLAQAESQGDWAKVTELQFERKQLIQTQKPAAKPGKD